MIWLFYLLNVQNDFIYQNITDLLWLQEVIENILRFGIKITSDKKTLGLTQFTRA